MTSLETFLASAWSALGWSIVHFLWQGAIVGVLAAALLSTLRRRTASARYVALCSALLACLVAFVGTFVLLLESGAASSGVEFALLGSASTSIAAIVSPSLTRSLVGELAAWCWTFGAALMVVRFAHHGQWARRLKSRSVTEPDAEWQGVFQSLKEDLGVSRSVRLLRSGMAETAMVVGWITPVILVPGSAFTSLSSDQLRSILAHELAHVRRYDHLVNMAQGVIEIILFFHPTVWWISKQIHVEREHCCDDSSLRALPNRKTLAEALARMESLRLTNPRAALAANGGSLMNRISRILGTQTGRSTSTGWRTPMALAIGTIIIAVSIGQAATTPAPHDPEAVGKRLREAVAAGELTADQARTMMQALKKAAGPKQKGGADSEAIAERLKAAVAAGDITAEQARAKWEAFAKGAAKKDEGRADLRAIGMKLRQAVAAGKLTPEEAKAKWEAISKGAAKEPARKYQVTPKKISPEDIERAAVQIRKMVAEGKITPEQGRAKMQALRKAAAGQAPRGEAAKKRVIDVQALRRRLAAAVESGRMTEGEAKAKLAEIMKQRGGDAKGSLRAEYARAEAELKKLVEAGKMSPEDARARLQAMRKRIAEQLRHGPKPDARADLARVVAEIRKAVADGKITPEQGRAKMQALRKKMGEQAKPQARPNAVYWERIKQRIEGAVKAGKMTREEADAKYRELKKQMAPKAKRSDVDWEGIKRRIEGAVKAGKMTREEADAKYRELKKQKSL